MRLRVTAALLVANLAFAHYQFVHYPSRSAPYNQLYEKFDLNALTDRTLPYFVAEPNNLQFATNDSFPALLSQIRAAAKVWNDVDTSDLRVAFGGVVPANTPQQGPHMQVVFEEVPPGIVAAGSPVVKAEANETFVPVVKSVVIIQPDLRQRPSYGEGVFSTLVHEIGHALGLQHTFTSGAMSTATTRATSKGRPLTADDIAGISLLYPRGNFQLLTGSISGRVMLGNAGVSLASVVAIAPNGAAVSTLTNPDGTYRIEGIPPRAYYVYVHPLPPALLGQTSPGDIIYPLDPEGRPFLPSAPFETVFYGGVRDVAASAPVVVTAGTNVSNIDFSVRARTNHTIHSVETYAFPGSFAVKPPYLNPGITYPFLVATGGNLIRSNAPVQGLAVSVMGGAQLGVRPYAPAASGYVQLDVDAGTLLIPSESPRHLVFSTATDIYVLPSAFLHVSRPAPAITAVTSTAENGTRLATIAGTNLSAETRILFDGITVPVRSLDDQGRLIVAAPSAGLNHRAVITAVNADGQSSMFLQADAPPTLTYDSAASAFAVLLTPSALSPGMEAMLVVEGLNTNFANGQLQIGFGTTDIAVRRIVVQSPTRALVNVVVSPNAQPATLNATVVSGLNVIQQQLAFQIQAAQARPFWLASLTMNPVSGQPSITPGNPAMMFVAASPHPVTSATTTVLLNDVRVPVTSVNNNQITFNVPANQPAGPTVVRVEIQGERSLPILINIDPAPRPEGPRVTSIVTTSSSQARHLKIGEIASVVIASNVRGAGSKVAITLGGKEVRVLQVFEEGEHYSAFIQVPEDAPAGENIPLVASVDGRASEPISLTITK